jgi:hypothetical protein
MAFSYSFRQRDHHLPERKRPHRGGYSSRSYEVQKNQLAHMEDAQLFRHLADHKAETNPLGVQRTARQIRLLNKFIKGWFQL